MSESLNGLSEISSTGCWSITPKRAAGRANNRIHVGPLGCFTKTFSDEKHWLNPLCKYLGIALKVSKRIFDFDNLFTEIMFTINTQHLNFSLSKSGKYVPLFCCSNCYFFWDINEPPNLHDWRKTSTKLFSQRTQEYFFQGRCTITEITVHWSYPPHTPW